MKLFSYLTFFLYQVESQQVKAVAVAIVIGAILLIRGLFKSKKEN